MNPSSEMCRVGKLLFDKGFVAANDGNLSYRLSETTVLCTPTMHSKGLLAPEHLCIVDLQGDLVEGTRTPSSEILLHLEIYRRRPDVNAVVHTHPPHATAFAIAREPIPQCVLPEVELFLGEVPIAPYETPGTQAFADVVAPLLEGTSAIVLANHGVVTYGTTLELATWWTEILEAYCRTLILAKQLGGIHFISDKKSRELVAGKQAWGFADSRNQADLADCDVCGNASYRATWAAAGARQTAFPAHPSTNPGTGSTREVGLLSDRDIDRIADRVIEKLQSAKI